MALLPIPGSTSFSDVPGMAPAPPGTEDATTIIISDGDPIVDPNTGAVKIETDDGGVTIDLGGVPEKSGPEKDDPNANLAEYITQEERNRIAAELLAGIANDDMSRQEWLQTRARGIEMLGFKLESARDDAGSSTAPVEGMSNIRHPLLAEAVVRFQAGAAAELMPAEGPVKVRNDTPPNASIPAPLLGHNGGPPMDDFSQGGTPAAPGLAPGMTALPPANPLEPPAPDDGLDFDVLAAALEKDLNKYLTVTDKGYRADFERMLFWCGFGGSAFRKVYYDPIKRMPISRMIDPNDMIVSDAANELDDAIRITHRIMMPKATLVRLMLAGVYRDIPGITSAAYSESDPIRDKIAEIQGFTSQQMRPEDSPFTIYECYTQLNIKGFEHKDEKTGKETGMPLPYRVTIDKDTQQILEIHRNWRDDDPMCLPKRCFVRYTFIDAMGIYGVGLLHLLGNATRTLTAAWRLMLDSGMFASFPGFLYSEMIGKQVTNEFRIPPGGGQRINTGNQPIQSSVMPLPYKDVSMGLMQLAKMVEEDGQRLGGTAELQVGEGKQDAPVGTTLALIEQATKVLAAVHIHLHAAQSEEFQLLKELFREYPESLWVNNRRPARQWVVSDFLAALENCDLVPAADPNTPSRMHRIMKAQAILLLSQSAPTLYNTRAVHTHILKILGGPDANIVLNTPDQQQAAEQAMAQQQAAQGKGGAADPSKMAAVQATQQRDQQQAQQAQAELAFKAQQQDTENKARWAEIQQESADRSQDRQSRESIAQMREQTQQIKEHAALTHAAIQAHTDIAAQQPQIIHVPTEGPAPSGLAPQPWPTGLIPQPPPRGQQIP